MNNVTFFKNNSLSDYSTHPKTLVIITCVLNAVFMFLAIIGNSLVLAAICRTPSLRSPSFTLLCSLAVSDLLVGLVGQPLYIAKELKEGSFLLGACYFISYGCCGVSLFTVTAISLDRFAALYYHMRYVTMVTTTRVICTLVPVWVFNFLGFVIYLWNKADYFICASVSTVVCFGISSFCYHRIFQIVRRHQIQVHAQHQTLQSSEASSGLNIMRLKKSSMNTFVFYLVMILCYSPILILLMLSGILRVDLTRKLHLSATIVFMNSSINPILYCWRITELRKAVVKTARKMFCTQADQE